MGKNFPTPEKKWKLSWTGEIIHQEEIRSDLTQTEEILKLKKKITALSFYPIIELEKFLFQFWVILDF